MENRLGCHGSGMGWQMGVVTEEQHGEALFCISIVVVVTGIYTCDKMYRTTPPHSHTHTRVKLVRSEEALIVQSQLPGCDAALEFYKVLLLEETE